MVVLLSSVFSKTRDGIQRSSFSNGDKAFSPESLRRSKNVSLPSYQEKWR